MLLIFFCGWIIVAVKTSGNRRAFERTRDNRRERIVPKKIKRASATLLINACS